MSQQRNQRFAELEQNFSQLEPHLKDSPEKEAISILHAMIQESRRAQASMGNLAQKDGQNGPTLADVANLYKSAPKMGGASENQGLQPGTLAPDFTLPDASGNQVTLSSYRGKNVVLVFYPLDWSPACSDQLSLYQSELEEIHGQNAHIIAVSVDSLYSHGAWSAVRGITFPLLADFSPKGEVASRYNVLRQSDGFSERALYVIDREGVIRHCHISPELHMIPDIYELFDQLKSLNSQAEDAPRH